MLKDFLSENKIEIIQGWRYSQVYNKEIEAIVSESLLKAKQAGKRKIYINEIKTDKINNRIIGWWLRKNNIITIKDSTKHGQKYIFIDY